MYQWVVLVLLSLFFLSVLLSCSFTMMLQNQQVPPTDIRDTVPQQLTASVKNQRLAQQMANRPSVLAALQNKLVNLTSLTTTTTTKKQIEEVKCWCGSVMKL